MASQQTNRTEFAAKKFVRRFFEYGDSTKKADRLKIDQAARLLAKQIGFDTKKYDMNGISEKRKSTTTRSKSSTRRHNS